MEPSKIIAAQLPAPCPLNCKWCRTPKHDSGDMSKVVAKLFSLLSGEVQEVYLTSNGETGLAKDFAGLVNQLFERNIRVSVLCATPASIVSGLTRAEVSYNEYTKYSALAAIKKAQELGISVVASLVDDGSDLPGDLATFANEIGVDGVLVRALQAEGNSQTSHGTTRQWCAPDIDMGTFPVAAYQELNQFEPKPQCINHYGELVDFLGAQVTV